MGWTRSSYFALQKQFFSSSLSEAPHYYMSLYTPSTQPCSLGCELYGLHEWATTWFPATKLYTHTWANRSELYEQLIRQDNLHRFFFSGCELPGTSDRLSKHTYMLSRGELWATNDPARDRSGVCKATAQNVKRLHRLRFDIDYVKVFGFPSQHR